MRRLQANEPVITMDSLPTILEMTGIDPPDPPVDGLSLVPTLRQCGQLPKRSLFWHYPHYQHYQQGGTTPYGAIRSGDWKLIELYDDGRLELYNLRNDSAEQDDLVLSSPERAQLMRNELHAWLKRVEAQMPARNPDYDPNKPEHTPSPSK